MSDKEVKQAMGVLGGLFRRPVKKCVSIKMVTCNIESAMIVIIII